MSLKKSLLLLTIIFTSFWAIFGGLQDETVFDNSLGQVADNWINFSGEKKLANVPFEGLNDENYVRWDATHYKLITDNGYDVEAAKGDYIFAFFPLFPLIWKISFLPPVGILFLNYSFFTIAILILSKLFSSEKNYLNTILIACSLPTLIIFFLPYTEATFLLTTCIGMYGFVKKRYWLFFTGFFLAALTRSTFPFLTIAFLSTELFFFFEHKKISAFIKNSLLRIAPLLTGTFAVSLIQLSFGSGSITKFMDVQKSWGRKFSVPHFLKDWSTESFSINVGVFVLILIPVMMVLIQKGVAQLKKIKQATTVPVDDSSYYLIILSLCYTVLLTFFILFFQDGSLNNLFRYSCTTPFFYILLFTAYPLIQSIPVNFRSFVISILAFIAIFIVGLSDFSGKWDFSDMGVFLTILSCTFWLFQEYAHTITYKVSLYLSIFINLVWTCYLFNCYIIDGWIFA
jgi:hypothetical protein